MNGVKRKGKYIVTDRTVGFPITYKINLKDLKCTCRNEFCSHVLQYYTDMGVPETGYLKVPFIKDKILSNPSGYSNIEDIDELIKSYLESDCSICHETLHDDEQWRCHICFNMVHMHCRKKWTKECMKKKEKNRCPCCNT